MTNKRGAADSSASLRNDKQKRTADSSASLRNDKQKGKADSSASLRNDKQRGCGVTGKNVLRKDRQNVLWNDEQKGIATREPL
jgi:hypothetical protein